MMKKLSYSVQHLFNKPTYRYHSLLGRPVDGLGPNALINMNLDFIQLLNESLPQYYGFIALGVTQYLLGAGIYYISKSYFERNNQSYKLDLFLDNNINQIKNTEQTQISSSSLLSSFVTSYYWLGMFRALSYLEIQQFNYDQTLILPLVSMFTNFLLIKYSNLSIFSAIQQRQYLFRLINLSFMMSLAIVGLPQTYLVVGISMQFTHLILRGMYNATKLAKMKSFEKSLRLTEYEKEELKRK